MSLQPGQLEFELQSIATAVRALAGSYQKDTQAILALLRQLEQLHREIRDGIFQASLPSNRQALHALLKDIESEGGWPYIERMRLQAFLANLNSQMDGGAIAPTNDGNAVNDADLQSAKD
jgi:hypothetical protein